MSLNKIKLRHRLVVLLFLVVLAGGWLLWNYKRPAYPSMPFDPLVWKQPAEGGMDPVCVRSTMALDLVEKAALDGKSARQAMELLGMPDEQGKGYWTYHLGQCPGMGWNDSDLRLAFDAGMERVQGATIEHVTVSESR